MRITAKSISFVAVMSLFGLHVAVVTTVAKAQEHSALESSVQESNADEGDAHRSNTEESSRTDQHEDSDPSPAPQATTASGQSLSVTPDPSKPNLVATYPAALPGPVMQSGIVLSVPDGMLTAPLPEPSVVVALKSASSTGYPTFNAIERAGAVNLSTVSASDMAQQIADEYRLVGFSDVLSTESFKWVDSQSVERITARMKYSYSGLSLCSEVTLAPGINKRYILTFVSECAVFPNLRSLAEKLRTGFRLVVPPTAKAGAGIPEDTGYKLLPLWLLLAIGIIMFFVVRRSSSQPPQEGD